MKIHLEDYQKALARATLSAGKAVYTLDHPANAHLLAQGIQAYASLQ